AGVMPQLQRQLKADSALDRSDIRLAERTYTLAEPQLRDRHDLVRHCLALARTDPHQRLGGINLGDLAGQRHHLHAIERAVRHVIADHNRWARLADLAPESRVEGYPPNLAPLWLKVADRQRRIPGPRSIPWPRARAPRPRPFPCSLLRAHPAR